MLNEQFVLGVDLDDVVGAFYAFLRPIAAEWLGMPLDALLQDVSYGLPEWMGSRTGEYEQLHRFAVTQKDLFRKLAPIDGAAAALRRLARNQEIRIRIITHRLYTKHTHQLAVRQTTEWLDAQGIPYWDLCFMREKGAVDANLYIEDSPSNIRDLQDAGKHVVIFSNSTNRDVKGTRANTWEKWKRKWTSNFENGRRKGVPLRL
jgi:5'(3')-deoxyribonucleotidase